MPLTVLTDADVCQVLESLTIDDAHALQKSLRKALHEYSTGTQGEAACAMHQPERTAMVAPSGNTTLLMPSTSSSGIGMKVVTLATPGAKGPAEATADMTPHGSLTIMSSNGTPTGFLNAEEVTAFRTALCSSLLFCRRKSFKSVTVFGAGRQAFWHIRLALILRGSSLKTVNIISRTFSDRVRDLLKTLYSVDPAIKEREGWGNVKFSILTPGYGEYARLLKEQLRAADVIITTVPSTTPLFDHSILTSTEGRRRGRLIIAIGSYKPHMIEIPVELFQQAVKPHEHRHYHNHASEGGVVVVDTLTGCLKEAGEIIQSGLSPNQLVEVGELVMLEGQLAGDSSDDHEVDADGKQIDLDGLRRELSDISSSGAGSMHAVMHEGSDLSTVSTGSTGRKSMDSARSSKSSSRKSLGPGSIGNKIRSLSMDNRKVKSKDDAMATWLREGNVVYKCVGMGLMDLVVGGGLITLAREKGVGTTIPNF
ncbi:hypothetical protein VC83_00174 [Pseudogymnoascus destructans]|uniref:Uncharacterized protein n=1 Tax=Pseudogymnoascus destructans TaxID=655981 RepID=A0A177AMP7_9PEZI|nr:uncharacterized protein VC83_00174 [Pseudogymnoascus destructans]OAF63349.1 hypothetical protein VC83_00174 [Pseudogymnoascus destructans]